MSDNVIYEVHGRPLFRIYSQRDKTERHLAETRRQTWPYAAFGLLFLLAIPVIDGEWQASLIILGVLVGLYGIYELHRSFLRIRVTKTHLEIRRTLGITKRIDRESIQRIASIRVEEFNLNGPDTQDRVTLVLDKHGHTLYKFSQLAWPPSGLRKAIQTPHVQYDMPRELLSPREVRTRYPGSFSWFRVYYLGVILGIAGVLLVVFIAALIWG